MELHSHLGKKSRYNQTYDPSLLEAVPRILNRKDFGFTDENLPFSGFDVWHAREFSFLTERGMPVTGIFKIVIPCDSEFLVESKSLKLYLNSLNMMQYGKSKSDGVSIVADVIKNDLEKLLRTELKIYYFDHSARPEKIDFKDFRILETEPFAENLDFDQYKESVGSLDHHKINVPIFWQSHLLRSKCKVTNQPDWGTAVVNMEGKIGPSPLSFLKYIVSLRNENHFHEEICELIFHRLNSIYKPGKLTVSCFYTRRGGIDINPVRFLKTQDSPFPGGLSANKLYFVYRQ